MYQQKLETILKLLKNFKVNHDIRYRSQYIHCIKIIAFHSNILMKLYQGKSKNIYYEYRQLSL